MYNRSGSRHERWLAFATAGIVVTLTHSAIAAPAWCSKAHKISDSEASSGLRDLKDGRPHYMLRALVDVTCHPTPEIEQNAAAIDKARAAWGAKLGLTTDADWADAAEWTTGDPTTQGMVKDDLSTKDIAKLTPIDQYLIAANDFVHFKIDSFYEADMMEPHLTEVGRLAIVENCVSVTNPSASDPLYMATCQPDIDAFDATKFFEQLRSDRSHNANSRIALRLRLAQLGDDVTKHKAIVEKLAKLDEAYAKMFAIAASARPAWMKSVGGNAALLETVQQAESAHFAESRKGLEACDEPTHAALIAAATKFDLAKLRPTRDVKGNLVSGFVQEQLSALLDDPELNVAATGVVVCGHRGDLAAVLSTGLRASYRGPRSAAYAMIAKANLVPDKKDDKEERRRINVGPSDITGHPGTRNPPWNINATSWSVGGVIKSVKKTSTALEIELTPIWIKYQDCTQGYYTNRIDHIESNGTVIYQYQCTSSKDAQMDDQQKGLKLDLKYAGIVKPGVRVALVGGVSRGGEPTPNADLVAQWASASQVKPSWLFGAVRK